MANWLKRLLYRLAHEELGYVGFYGLDRYPGDEGGDEGGEGDGLEPGDELEEGDGYNPGDGDDVDDLLEGDDGLDEDDDGDDGSSDGLDDEKVVAYLKSKGLDFENLDKIKNLKENLGGVTKQHQSATDVNKALRAALGDQYDAHLAKGMKSLSGQPVDDEDSGAKEPEHFKSWTPIGKSQIEATQNHYFNKNIQQVLPKIIEGVTNWLNEKEFTKENPDYDDNRDTYDSIAKEYGISSRSPKSLALIKQIITDKAKDGIADLSGKNDDKGTKLGRPAPKGADRGAKKPAFNWETATDKQIEQEYERRKKETANK